MPRPTSSQPLLEAHLTVHELISARVGRFEEVCQELNCRPLLIELARGVHRQQAMATAQVSDAEQAQGLARQMQNAGFPVRRIKLETVLEDIRQPACYLEWHGKLQASDSTQLERAALICADFGAHFSHNSLRGAALQRFATLRVYPASATEESTQTVQRLRHQAQALSAALQAADISLSKQIFEKCIADSLPVLDTGWLDNQGTTKND